MYETEIQPKVKVGDRVKIVDIETIISLYDEERNLHTRNTLIFLSQQNLIWDVIAVEKLGLDLYQYKIKYGMVEAYVCDSDIEVQAVINGELYTEVPVYLCWDCKGGMCDRLCFGDKALISNANASIDCWNEGYTIEDSEYVEHTNTVEGALSILATDNFDVIKVKPNTVHVAEDFIVTAGANVTTYCKCYTYVHNVEHIYDLLLRKVYNNPIIDLTVATDDV